VSHSQELPQNETEAARIVAVRNFRAGHVRAAQALEKAFRSAGRCAVEHIDALQHVSKLFQRVYDRAYISMVRRAPELMGVLYERTDQPWLHPRRRLALEPAEYWPDDSLVETHSAGSVRGNAFSTGRNHRVVDRQEKVAGP